MILLDRDAIEQRLDLDTSTVAIAAAIEEAYRSTSRGAVTLTPVGHLAFPDYDGDCHVKSGHRHGDDFFVVKVATGFPNNTGPDTPGNNGVSLVLSATTGAVLAVLHDKMLLTDVRTAIGAAVAGRALARPDAHRLLVVGTGIQAGRQLQAHRQLFHRPLEARVWGRNSLKAAAVAEAEGVEVATDLADACRWADIVVTVTAARQPIIDSDWITPGTHVTAVGADAPGKHELDPTLLARADRLVADATTQCLDHGEFSVLDGAGRIVELGAVLDGRATGRTDDRQITVADLTGIASQDVAIAGVILGR